MQGIQDPLFPDSDVQRWGYAKPEPRTESTSDDAVAADMQAEAA
jgi:hypothetical protein